MRRNDALLVLVLPVLTLLTTVALAFSLQREEHTLFSSALSPRRSTPVAARAVPPLEQDPVQALFEAAIELCEKRVDRRNYGRNDVSLASVPKLLTRSSTPMPSACNQP